MQPFELVRSAVGDMDAARAVPAEKVDVIVREAMKRAEGHEGEEWACRVVVAANRLLREAHCAD